MNLKAIKELLNKIKNEIDAAITEDTNSELENELNEKRAEKKQKPSDDIDKRFMLQNLTLQKHKPDIYKRAVQLEVADVAELINSE